MTQQIDIKLTDLRHGDIVFIWDAYNKCPNGSKYRVEYIGNRTYGFFGIEKWMFEPSQLAYWGKYRDGYWFPWQRWKNDNDLDFLWYQKNPRSIYYNWKLIKKQKEIEMNQIIIESFPQTKDAVIVEKWFGNKLNDPLMGLLLKGKEDELLEEALRLEKKEITKCSK